MYFLRLESIVQKIRFPLSKKIVNHLSSLGFHCVYGTTSPLIFKFLIGAQSSVFYIHIIVVLDKKTIHNLADPTLNTTQC